MGRRRKQPDEEPQEPLDLGAMEQQQDLPQPPPVQEPEEKEPNATLTVKGSARKIRNYLGGENGQTRRDPEVAPGIAEALADDMNLVIVYRHDPETWNGFRIAGEVFRRKCPISWGELESKISSKNGGGEYRAEIIEEASGTRVKARNFEIPGDPLIPTSALSDAEQARMFMRGAEPEESPPDAIAQLEEDIDQQARIASKQFKLEGLKSQIAGLKDQKDPNRISPALDSKIRELEANLAATQQQALQAQFEAQLAAESAKHQAEIAELKRLITAGQQQRPAEDPMIKLLMQMNADSNKRFEAMMAQMNDRRMDAVMKEMEELKSKKHGSDDSIEKIINIAKLLGVPLKFQGRDEDDEEDDEDKEWYEVLLEKYVPKIFDLIEDRKANGQPPMTKEELIAQFNSAADKAAGEHLARARAITVEKNRVASGELPPPAAAPVAPPQPTAVAIVPAEPSKPQLTLIEKPPTPEMVAHQEVMQRIGAVLAKLSREMLIRSREYEWSFDAWSALPPEIVEKMGKAADPVAMLGAFDGTVNQEKLDMLKARVASDPKIVAWIGLGLSEMKQWVEQLATDPTFDPSRDLGEPEEGQSVGEGSDF